MKNFHFIGLWCLILWAFMPTAALAQHPQVVQAEYYWNTDPGQGLGTPVDAADGNFNSAFEQLVKTGMTLPAASGIHRLYVRVKGHDGVWSNAFSTMVSIESLLTARDLKITQAEYFWNTDPGQGNGTALVAFDGNFNDAFETAFANGVNAPNFGLNTLHVRYRGLDGAWSNTFRTIVSVENLVSARDLKITQAEYFWNTDPGQGNGTALVAFDGNFNDAFEAAFANGVNAPNFGLNTLHVRYRGLDGAWSNTFRTIVSVENLLSARDLKITQAEYFWNTDPGQGNGTALVAFDGNFNDAFEAAFANGVNAPNFGLNTLHVRYRGLDGAWSNTFRTIVSVENLLSARDLKITQAEYFWNTDPGQGNGTPLLAFDGNFNNAFEVAFANGISAPGMGLNKLHVRFRGLDGVWSNVFTTMVSIESLMTARDIKVIQQEFFFDTDPGEGNGTPLFVVESPFTTGTGTINSAILSPGQHILHVRTRGLDGAWSNLFRTAIYVDPCLTSPSVAVTPAGPLNLCPGGSLVLSSQNVHSAYQWFKGAQLVGSNDTLTVTEPGYYYLVGLDAEGCAGVSNGVWVNAIAVPSLAISPSGTIELCSGQSVVLGAVGGPFVQLQWSTGQFASGIQVTNAGTYTVTGTHSSGCQVTSAPVTVNVNSAPSVPVITADGPTTFCIGGSVVLTSSYASGNLWSTGETTQSITVTQSGNYHVSYTSGENCSSTSNITTVSVGNPSAPISQSGVVEVCSGNTLILWTTSILGYSYNWYKDGVGNQANNSQIAITQPGNYWVVVTDPYGCQATSATAEVVFLALPTASITPLGPTTFCSGGSVELQASAGSAWLWNNGANTQTISASAGGNYSVTVWDANGCYATSAPVTITLTSPLASVSVDNNVLYLPNATANFTSTANAPIVNYDWQFGDGGTANTANPTHEYTVAGFYSAALNAVDENGCAGGLNVPGIIEVWAVYPTEDQSLPTTQNALSSTWLSPTTGFVTLPDGTICWTQDGGNTWSVFGDTGTGQPFYYITNHGDANNYCTYIAGADGNVWVSINGGPFTSISPQGLTAGTVFYGGTFVNGSYGYLLGSNNTICIYYNGVWTAINPSGPGIYGNTIWYGGYWYGGTFYAVGSGGVIYAYSGSGSGGSGGTWGPVTGNFGGTNFYGVTYGTSCGCAYAVGSGGAIYVSYDGGATWVPCNTGGYAYNWYGVAVYGSTVVAVGEGGAVLVSLDGGVTWTLYSIGTQYNCNGITLAGCVAYITTDNGGVYSFNIPGYAVPTPAIAGDTVIEICNTDPAHTFAVANPQLDAIYLWSNGAVGTTMSTNFGGNYTVQVNDVCGSQVSSAVSLVVNNCTPPCLPDLAAQVDNYVFYLPNATANFTSSTTGNVSAYDWQFGDGGTSTDANPSHTYTVPGFYVSALTGTGEDNCTNAVNVPGVIEVWQVFGTDNVSLPVPDDALCSTWLSSETGYVTLPDGTLCYTTNGGGLWTPITTGVNVPWYYVNSYDYAGNYYTWIAGGNGSVCYSYNGGPWVATNPQGLTAGTVFYGGNFYAPSYGYFVGSNNTVCWYNNGTWVGINPPTGGGVTENTVWYGSYYNNGILYIVGTGGLICYYSGGQWYPVNFNGAAPTFDFYNCTYSAVCGCSFAVGANGQVYASFDGGLTWIICPTGYNYNWYDVAIIGTTVIVVGEGGAVCVSTDSGTTWELNSIGTDKDCLSIRVQDCVAYITTRDGGVYRYLIPNYVMPQPVIAGDSFVEICVGDPAHTFEVFEPKLNATYTWNTSETGTSISTSVIGQYNVQISNFCGTATSETVELSIVNCAPPCFGDLNAQADNNVFFLPNATVNFTSSAGDPITTYAWDFGDGGNSADTNPAYTYTTAGFYTASLTATDDTNCSNTTNVAPTIEVWQVFNTDEVSLPVPDDALCSAWLSPETGWVTLPNGSVCYTNTGGSSWSSINTGAGVPFYYVSGYGYAGNYATWIAGGNGTVCVSTNGGAFVPQIINGLAPGTTFYGGTFVSVGYGYFVGSNNTVCLYDSSNPLNNGWSDIHPPLGGGVTENTVWRGSYVRNGILYIVGSNGLICYYSGGQWFPVNFTGTAPSFDFYNCHYSEACGCAFAVGLNGQVYASFDGGLTWIICPTGYNYHWYDVAVIGTTVIVVGQNGAVCVSTNSGTTWELSNIGTYEDCLSIRIRECVAYITTRSGGVYRYLIPNYVMPLPVIAGPSQVTVCNDAPPHTFEVSEPKLNATYLWSNGQNGTSISTLTFGFYTVQVSNFCGTATSLPVELVIEDCTPCQGDLNGDNLINFADLSLLLSFMGNNCPTQTCPGDLNGDQVVNFSDLSLLLANYGGACP